MTARRRILEYIESKGISKYKFYKDVGVSNGYLDKEGNVGSDICEKISYQYADLSLEWLITGQGNMLKEAQVQHNIQPEKLASKVSLMNYANIEPNIISIPIVDVSAAAGHGFFNSDNPEKLGEINWPANMLIKSNGNYYCGRVNGESMTPTMLHHDFIIFRLLRFDEWINIKDNDVYFIVDRSGVSCVKRIKNRFKEDQSIICISDSIDKLAFRDFSIKGEDISNIYHVEWRFSKDMTNINELYHSRLDILEDEMKEMKESFKKLKK